MRIICLDRDFRQTRIFQEMPVDVSSKDQKKELKSKRRQYLLPRLKICLMLTL